jgi:radical SAM protein with 4Fe4S-binding SPASM domain
MKYKLSKDIFINQSDGKEVFVNPIKESWIKGKSGLRDYIDKAMTDVDENCNIQNAKLIKRFYDAGIIERADEAVKQDIDDYKVESLYLILTNKCNMSCEFCSVNGRPDLQEDNVLTYERIKKLLLSFDEIKKIILTGGEPTLREDILDIIDFAYDKLHSKILLCTNGLLLTKDFIERIQGKVCSIELSLENIFENEEQEKAILDLLDYLKQKKISKSFSFVLTSKNSENVFKFIDVCVKYDAAISIKPVVPSGRALKNRDILIEQGKMIEIYGQVYRYIYDKQYNSKNIENFIKKPLIPKTCCAAKKSVLAVYPNGDVYPCHSLAFDELKFGNIMIDTDKEIFDKRIELLDSEFAEALFSIDKRIGCSDCEVRYFCHGACLGEIFNKDASAKAQDCLVKKNIIKHLLWEYESDKGFMKNLEVLIKRFDKQRD